MAFNPDPYNRVKQSIYVTAILIVLYVSYWTIMYGFIKKHLADIYAAAPEYNLTFVNGTPAVSGFPLLPGISFLGDIVVGDIPVIVPEFNIRGLFIPGTVVKAEAPLGLAFLPPGFSKPIELDLARLRFVMFAFWPDDFSMNEITQWQRRVTKIDITDFVLRGDTFSIRSAGFIGLDSDLQPIADIQLEITGYADLLERLVQEEALPSQEAAIAKLALDGMAKENPLTKAKTATLDIRIADQNLYLGPLQVARLPAFVWGTRN